MKNIAKIFNSEDEVELKQAFKEIIIEQFRDDLERSDTYLFDPSDVEEMIQDAFKEIVDEIKATYKIKLREEMNAAFDKKVDKLLAK